MHLGNCWRHASRPGRGAQSVRCFDLLIACPPLVRARGGSGRVVGGAARAQGEGPRPRSQALRATGLPAALPAIPPAAALLLPQLRSARLRLPWPCIAAAPRLRSRQHVPRPGSGAQSVTCFDLLIACPPLVRARGGSGRVVGGAARAQGEGPQRRCQALRATGLPTALPAIPPAAALLLPQLRSARLRLPWPRIAAAPRLRSRVRAGTCRRSAAVRVRLAKGTSSARSRRPALWLWPPAKRPAAATPRPGSRARSPA